MVTVYGKKSFLSNKSDTKILQSWSLTHHMTRAWANYLQQWVVMS